MEKYIVSKYLVYVKNIKTYDRVYYILEKDSKENIVIKEIKDNIKQEIQIEDIKEKRIKEVITNLNMLLKVKSVKYAAKHLISLLKKEPTLLEYGNAKEYQKINDGEFEIRIVNYYYDSNRRLYNKILGEAYSNSKIKG